jgi:UDP-N-acetylglucosamine diphosphorylase/glucosamine-1-phosphate N-acetyltransferase
MRFILYDPAAIRADLLPLTYIRPIAEIRVGILTIREKWEHYLGQQALTLSETYIGAKYPFVQEVGAHIYINASLLPSQQLVDHIKTLKDGEILVSAERTVAFCSSKRLVNIENLEENIALLTKINYGGTFHIINHPYDIFKHNATAIESDFALVTKDRTSQKLSETNTLIGDASQLFIEEGASVECAILNVKGGPIYIGKDAEIMEGCLIRGPFSLGEQAGLKMGAKIYGGTTIGPHCRIGGEVSNSVFFGYSNKGHDGFVGNSVIGEWCNFGADTNVSNLKNNYDNISVWNYREEKYINTGMQFHGLIMGDHSKCSINTMFNTGTVVGVSANIFGSGFPDKFVPSFTWGGGAGHEVFKFDKAMEVAIRMMDRRHVVLSQADIDILKHTFELEKSHRENYNKSFIN